jgi:integrase
MPALWNAWPKPHRRSCHETCAPPSGRSAAGARAAVGHHAAAFHRAAFPEVRRPSDLRRDPHILGWLEHLWLRRARVSGKPCCNQTRGAHLIRLRKLFDLLADHAFPPRAGLLLSEDIPRLDQVLPRPLTPEDDARLQSELYRRNDLLSNALLLTRLTGMRIGETVDLSTDALRHLGGRRLGPACARR